MNWLDRAIAKMLLKRGGKIIQRKMEEPEMKSWQTTLAGVFTILAAVSSAGLALVDGNPATSPDWGVLIAAITAGYGLIKARDQAQHNKDKANGE